MTKPNTVTPVVTWQSDEWSHYGLWRIDGIGEVGCVVGVPEYLRGTATAARSSAGLIDAWYADPTDWMDEGESVRDAALNVLRSQASELANMAPTDHVTEGE